MNSKKGLEEQRNELKNQMQSLIATAKSETRALSDEEVTKFDNLEKEIASIDATIEREDKMNDLEVTEPVVENESKELTTDEKRFYNSVEERDETKAFAAFIRNSANGIEERTETNLTKGENGKVIPKTIANKIIEKVKEIAPVYASATKYNSKGTLAIPVEDESDDKITVAYATEFQDLESHSNKFDTIELTGYLYGALTKISKSLLNNTDLNLTNWVINKMAKKIAIFVENELLNGTENKISGVARSYDTTKMKVTLANKAAITVDELIELQEKLPDVNQTDAYWVMNKDTRTSLRKVKNNNGDYVLNKDLESRWGYTLLGKDVYISDNISKLGTVNKNVLMYGDFSGLAVKETEKAEIQILREKYATQHAIGIVAWGEMDSKIEDTSKIAVAVTPAA